MYIFRFLGVLLALIIAFVVSMLTQIDLVTILAIIAFVMAVDDAVWTFISNIYMRAVYKNIEKQTKEIERRDDGDSFGD